jgi:hypothetical protein
MSRLNFSQSLDFEGAVAVNGNPRVFLDGGPTIEEIVIETNLAADEFTLVVSVDGDDRVEMTGQQLLDREAYDGRAATSGQFVLAFADAIAKTLQGEGMTGLTTQPGQRVLVSIEIGASIAAGSPAATLHVESSPNRPEEFRLYILPEIVPVTKTGQNEFSGFRRGDMPNKHFMRRFFGYGAVTHFSFKQDRRSIYGDRELAKAVNDARLLRNGKTVPTSSTCYVYDPVLKGNVIADLQDTFYRETLRARFTTSDSNDITALTEYVHDVRVA